MPTIPTLSAQEFVAKWRPSKLRETASYAEHFIDLCRLIGHDTPAEADKEGTSFTFQAGLTKQQGGRGWADVWKKGFFAWEYKGKHANLDKAYEQLLQYRESLQNPPLLIVSDIERIIIHTNFTNTVKQIITLTFDDLLTPAGLARLRAVFYEPDAFKAPQTTAQVTKEAAEQFAKLAALLRKWEGEDPEAAHRIAHFLIRLLFCLFAEDIKLLPNNLFSRLVERTRTRPQQFTDYLRQLFGAMASGGDVLLEEVPHFNGRLFDNTEVLELDSDGLAILAKVSTLDWSNIEPAILGTLFERSLDPSKRSQLGAHYTSRDDILLIVEPVLMAPLRRRWEAVQAQARDLAARRDAASGGQRTRLDNELRGLLTGFAHEISQVRVLDPACGSGNFLYVALKQLLDLEKAVITFAGDLGAGTFFPSVSPEQLRGIEINEYAHELAQVTVWIGYIQWLRDNGFGQPSQPILKPLDTIVRMDAILAFDEQGRPIEPEWPEADIVIGNPPFLGGSKLRRELGDAYTEQLWSLYEGRVLGASDLVCYWFEHARTLIEADKIQRAGLLATQAIRAGASRKVLERIKQKGDIFMAWSDRPWVLEGAAVRVSLIGFDDASEQIRVLDGIAVASINPNLTREIDLTKAKRLQENAQIVFKGTSKAGPFELNEVTAQQMLVAKGNPNGRPNSDVIKHWISGSDITHRFRGLWLIDFGVGMEKNEAALYEQPFEYVKKHVYPVRSQNRRAVYAQKWWQHAEARPGMRQALKSKSRFIVTPRVAKHRVFVWIGADMLPDDRTFVFARDDDYFFGTLHSRPHEIWSLATSSRHGDGDEGGRPTYNNTTCFETFPFPWSPGHEPADDPRVAAIAQAARELVEKRDRWLNPEGADEAELKKRTLTNLYNQRPTWLDLAHKQLDQAVFDAYGWPHDLTDEQILERLLALNLDRAARQGGTPPPAQDNEADEDE